MNYEAFIKDKSNNHKHLGNPNVDIRHGIKYIEMFLNTNTLLEDSNTNTFKYNVLNTLESMSNTV